VTGDAYERLRRDYAPVFLQYLSEGGEWGRRAAYELGRRAIGEQLSVLDLARIHHGMLLDVLKTHRSSQELEHIAQAASEFLVEALAVFEMTQRATGVLMERHRLSATTAAERLRQTAARQGIAVEEAATRLLRQPSAAGRRRSGR
jgi:ANTAR domain/Phosphoserine phosphatase RsbU, N-terminal domain